MAPGRIIPLLLLTLLGCSTPDDEKFSIFSQSYDFHESTWGWQADFCDYPVDDGSSDSPQYEWKSEYTLSPGGSLHVLKLECDNASPGMFMFIKKKISGLVPKMTYNLVFDVSVFSNVPLADSPILKAGAVSFEPEKSVTNDQYELNLDKGDTDYISGKDMIVLGDLNSVPMESGYGYSTVTNSTTSKQFQITTNDLGEIWLVVGTELPGEGVNTILYRKIEVVFSGSN